MEMKYEYRPRIRRYFELLIVGFVVMIITHIFDVFAMEGVIYNHPIVETVREVIVFEQHYPQNYIVPSTAEFLTRESSIKLNAVNN